MERKICLVTVHVEKGGVFSHSSLVLSIARVVASMPRFDSVDSEHANFLAVSRYDNSVVCAQISFHLMFTIRKGPPNVEIAKIALRNCTNSGHRIIEIYFILSK